MFGIKPEGFLLLAGVGTLIYFGLKKVMAETQEKEWLESLAQSSGESYIPEIVPVVPPVDFVGEPAYIDYEFLY